MSVQDRASAEPMPAPVWDAAYRMSSSPSDFAHVCCCRDLDWRQMFCGFEDPDPVIDLDPKMICTMCLEVAGDSLAKGTCPVDDRPCPDEETLDRMIAERTGGR